LLVLSVSFSETSWAYRFGNVDVKLRPSVNETYDNNITFVKNGKVDDFITHVNFGADVSFEDKMRSLTLSGDVHHSIFLDKSKFNNTAEELNLDFLNEFTKYDRIRVTDNYSHTYEPRSFEDAFGRSRGRYSYHNNYVKVEYSHDVTQQLAVLVKFSNQLNKISSAGLSDSYTNMIGADVFYFINPETRIGIDFEFRKRTFDIGGNSTTDSLSATVRRYITQRLYFDGKIGADFIDSFDGSRLTRPSFEASLTEEVDQVTTAKLSFTKSYNTTSFATDLFNEWRVSGFLTREITKRLAVSGSFFYGEGEYISSRRKDKLSGASLSLDYDLLHNLKGSVVYSYSEVSSTDNLQSYAKNVVSLGLGAEF